MLQQASLSPRAITGLAITAALVALVPLRLVAVPAVDLAPIDAVERSTPAPADAAVDRSGAPQPVVDVRERHRERGDGHAWIYFYPDSDRVMMSGDTDDIAMAKRLRGERGRAFFVFRKGGEVYTIVDEPTLARIAEIFEPQRRLGEEQGQLGARQGELGSEQGRLGARQGMLGAEQGGLGLRQAQLSAQLAEIEARRQRVAIDRLREGDTRRDGYARAEEESRARALAIERDLREIDARHAALAEQHEALGREQEALGRRQGELGAEQERLGAQQARIAVVVERQLTELLERAVAEGIAKSVR